MTTEARTNQATTHNKFIAPSKSAAQSKRSEKSSSKVDVKAKASTHSDNAYYDFVGIAG